MHPVSGTLNLAITNHRYTLARFRAFYVSITPTFAISQSARDGRDRKPPSSVGFKSFFFSWNFKARTPESKGEIQAFIRIYVHTQTYVYVCVYVKCIPYETLDDKYVYMYPLYIHTQTYTKREAERGSRREGK